MSSMRNGIFRITFRSRIAPFDILFVDKCCYLLVSIWFCSLYIFYYFLCRWHNFYHILSICYLLSNNLFYIRFFHKCIYLSKVSNLLYNWYIWFSFIYKSYKNHYILYIVFYFYLNINFQDT